MKVPVNKEVVIGVFLYIERAYDMLWKEGLVINCIKLVLREGCLTGLKIS